MAAQGGGFLIWIMFLIMTLDNVRLDAIRVLEVNVNQNFMWNKLS